MVNELAPFKSTWLTSALDNNYQIHLFTHMQNQWLWLCWQFGVWYLAQGQDSTGWQHGSRVQLRRHGCFIFMQAYLLHDFGTSKGIATHCWSQCRSPHRLRCTGLCCPTSACPQPPPSPSSPDHHKKESSVPVLGLEKTVSWHPTMAEMVHYCSWKSNCVSTLQSWNRFQDEAVMLHYGSSKSKCGLSVSSQVYDLLLYWCNTKISQCILWTFMQHSVVSLKMLQINY